MAVDLKSHSLLSRSSLVIMPDCLVKLEHSSTQDRVKRFTFDTIEKVIIWKRFAWGRFVIVVICLVVPGVLLITMSSDLTVAALGGVPLAIGAVLAIWYVICRKTTIRIFRGGTLTDISGLYRPSRINRFRDRLVRGILDSQTHAGPPPLSEISNSAIPAD